MKQSIQVTILGQQFTLRSEASPEEVHRVAAFVNDKVAEAASASRTVDTLSAAILALLNVAGLYLRLRDGSLQENRQSEEVLRRLLERVEQSFPAPNDSPA